MERRRESPRDFNVEIHTERPRELSPHVLDLRRHSITREIILRELAGIESHDAELASSLGISLTIDRQAYLDSDHWGSVGQGEMSAFTLELIPPRKKYTSSSFGMRTIRSFSFVAGSVAIILLGSFFFQKNLDLKNEGVAQSLDAYGNLLDAEVALKNLDFEGASSDFAKAYENLVSAEGALEAIGGLTVSIVENIPLDSRPASSIALLRAAKHVARAGEMISSALAVLSPDGALSVTGFLEVLTPSLGGKRPQEVLPTFGVFEEALVSTEGELAHAQYEIGRVDPDDFPDEFRGSISELAQKIPSLLAFTRALQEYSLISSLLLGEDGPKRYLVLFQNSSELRPTGGFIGSYAVIYVEGSKLKDMFVDGIYNADGQLAVNVVPPKPFQHITTAWSMHDANWFLDFPSSAEKISWFYERTGGGKVDGVMTLNVEVIEQLLALTGPIRLDGYDLVLNTENFRDEIQYEVEVAYDKKLNRPKQVLSDFTPIFLEKLFETSKIQSKELLSVLQDALEQKYIMLYFKDTRLQEFFVKEGWGGTIYHDPCGTSSLSCSKDDYLSVVHSNIGGHKTDKLMQDTVSQRVKVQEDGTITSHVILQRTHTGGNTKYWWYNRPNIDYVKIYVPQGSQVLSVAGGQRREVANLVAYKELGFVDDDDVRTIEATTRTFGSVDIFEESGKTVLGTWLITKPKETTEFEIRYKLPFKVFFRNGVGKYNLYVQKQAGVRAKVAVALDVPDIWEVLWANSESKELEQSFLLDIDRVIGYILKK